RAGIRDPGSGIRSGFAQKSHEQDEHREHEQRDLRHHRHADVERHRTTPATALTTFGRLATSGVVAVSIVPTAIHGATPKITSVAIRMPSAAHSGPCALQKICFVTRSTYTAVRNAPITPGKSHHGCAELHAPRNVRNSATKPAVAGRPSDDRPAMVNAVAMPGIIVPKPPIVKMARECVFS